MRIRDLYTDYNVRRVALLEGGDDDDDDDVDDDDDDEIYIYIGR